MTNISCTRQALQNELQLSLFLLFLPAVTTLLSLLLRNSIFHWFFHLMTTVRKICYNEQRQNKWLLFLNMGEKPENSFHRKYTALFTSYRTKYHQKPQKSFWKQSEHSKVKKNPTLSMAITLQSIIILDWWKYTQITQGRKISLTKPKRVPRKMELIHFTIPEQLSNEQKKTNKKKFSKMCLVCSVYTLNSVYKPLSALIWARI